MRKIELIVATGRKAGTAAPIQVGYYLIGRHEECQIRPKSRSVSRRHCLLHHHEHGLAVFDLQSTAGTYVNDQKLDAHCWIQLTDGDQLSCGKVTFAVAIKQFVATTSGPSAAGNQPSEAATDAWQESDIAHFLESEDDADREQRYNEIKTISRTKLSQNAPSNLDAYEDTPLEKDDRTPVETKESKKGKKRKKPKPLKMPKKKKRGKTATGSRFSFPLISMSDGDHWKLIGAAALAIVFLGFFGFQMYSHNAGPAVELLEELD